MCKKGDDNIKTSELLNLMHKKKGINEISFITGESIEDIKRRIRLLEDNGYTFEKSYTIKGNTIYRPKRVRINEDSIKPKVDSTTHTTAKVLIISDLHLTDKHERVDLLYKLYEYAAKNDIHIIINLGDFIEIQRNVDPRRQLETIATVHPYDKDIINYILYGNHDFRYIQDYNYDIAKELEKERPDLVNLGYFRNQLYIKNDLISLKHKEHDLYPDNDEFKRSKITLIGHSHKSKFTHDEERKYRFLVPPLSDCFPGPALVK